VAYVCWSGREVSRDAADGPALTRAGPCRCLRASGHVHDSWVDASMPINPGRSEIQSCNAHPRVRDYAC
jgi:hypothetical protein